MAHLSFSLLPNALIRLHDALICLAKFSESVALEAEYDLVSLSTTIQSKKNILTEGFQLRLSVLDSTKTAYSAFALEADSFFENYSFSLNTASSSNGRSIRFSCQLYLKVGKGRLDSSSVYSIVRYDAKSFTRRYSQSSKEGPATRIKTRQSNAARLKFTRMRSRQNADSLFE